MHRIDGPAATPGSLFTEGDPSVGTPATVVTDDWLNAVQEEIVGVIVGAGMALNKANNAQLLAAVVALMAARLPPGAIAPFATSTAPAGWLKCNGQAVSRTTYAALFAAIGTTWGAGDGSTTFNVPDLRGEFLRGLDDGRGVDAGRGLGSSQADQIEAHKHVTPWGEAGSGLFGQTTTASHIGSNSTDGDNYWWHTNDGTNFDGAVNSAGIVGAETRPRNVAVLYCIST